MGSDGGKREAGMAAKQEAHLFVELFAGLFVTQAFAVRRIAQECALLCVDLTLPCVADCEAYMSAQAGLLQMAIG